MADKKISQLTDLPAASVAPSTDVLAIVDTSATETKKVTAKALVDGALNAGTANGVLYLNGSKEATSGSALTFNGTTLDVTGTVDASSQVLVGTNDSVFAENNLRFKPSGAAYIDHNTVGQSINFRLSNASSLDVTPLVINSSGIDVTGTVTADGLNIDSPGGSSAKLVYTNNDQGNLRIQLANSGAGGNTWELVGGLPGVNNANFSLYDVTGTATRLTVDTSGNLGIGTSSPASQLHVKGSGNGWVTIQRGNDASNIAWLTWMNNTSDANQWGMGLGTANSNNFNIFNYTTSSSAVVIDTSSNVGIGTSSPGGKLQVDGGRALFTGSNEDYTVGIGRESNANSYYLGVHSTTSPNLLFSNNAGTTNMTLTYDGNLGLGVSPSAWRNLINAFQVGGTGAAIYAYTSGTGQQDFNISNNSFENSSGNDIYIRTNPAAKYQQYNNQHRWYNAASGTAGNAISFTQAMTLDANGDLAIGRTSVSPIGSGYRTIDLDGASGSGVRFRSGGSTVGYIYNAGSSFLDLGTSTSAPITFTTNGSERARITSGGDVGIGTSSPVTLKSATTLQVNGNAKLGNANDRGLLSLGDVASNDANCGIWRGAAGAYGSAGNYLCLGGYDGITFTTGNSDISTQTERARITSGGYFKASNTGTYVSSTGSYHELVGSGSGDYAAIIRNTTSTNPYGILCDYTGAAPNTTGLEFLVCRDSGPTIRATIRSNGGLANYQSNNVDLSDIRTKKDITPAASMWDKIGALEIVTYKYNDQTHDDVNVGVIAQQVESVEPVWVDADGFGETPEGEEPLKTVYTKDITFAAIKALQEAMTRIEELEAKVAALEAK